MQKTTTKKENKDNFSFFIRHSSLKAGFTLVEVILYVGLVSIFMGVISNVFLDTLDVKKDVEGTSAVEQDSRTILSRINYDAKNADSLVSPGVFGADSNSVTFETLGVETIYLVDLEGSLVVSQGGVTEKLTGSETVINNITFTKIGNVDGIPSVRVVFEIEGKVDKISGKETRTYETTVGLR